MAVSFLRRPGPEFIGAPYLAGTGLSPGRYSVASLCVAPMFGPHPTVIGYIIRHNGRLVRCWLS